MDQNIDIFNLCANFYLKIKLIHYLWISFRCIRKLTEALKTRTARKKSSFSPVFAT